MIRFDHVSKRYPNGREAVSDLSLEIARGEIVFLTGHSGAGKSTVVNLLLRFYDIQQGHILIDGQDMAAVPPWKRPANMMFQSYALFPPMSVPDNIAFGLPFADDAAVLAAAEVAGMQDYVNRHPRGFEMPVGERGDSLSGGQRQRIAIARALAPKPEVLIADEPVSALDVSVRAQVLNLLTDLVAAQGLTLVVVSHDLLVVRHLCDQLAVMRQGRIVEQGDTEAVYNQPGSDYTPALLAAIPRIRTAG